MGTLTRKKEQSDTAQGKENDIKKKVRSTEGRLSEEDEMNDRKSIHQRRGVKRKKAVKSEMKRRTRALGIMKG